MILRSFDPKKDFEKIQSWTADRREHAMWCADRFPYPLDKTGFMEALSAAALRSGDVPFVAAVDDDAAAGFFCCSMDPKDHESRLKFVIVDPQYRGKGAAREMLGLAVSYIFTNTTAEAVRLSVFPENIRAKKCYEKAGFQEIKTDHGAFLFQDESWDRCAMILKRPE